MLRSHGGRRLSLCGRKPPGGRLPSSGGGGGADSISPTALVGGGELVGADATLLVSSGGGSRRWSSRWLRDMLLVELRGGGEGSTTVGLFVIPSGFTLAPSTGRTKTTFSSDQSPFSPADSREMRLVSP